MVSGHFGGLSSAVEFDGRHGADLRLPHSRAMGEGLFELRCKGAEGIGRVFYCTMVGRQIVILHSFIKKPKKRPTKNCTPPAND